MAPFTRPAGSNMGDTGFTYTNGAPQTASNEPEIIEIDDDDDEVEEDEGPIEDDENEGEEGDEGDEEYVDEDEDEEEEEEEGEEEVEESLDDVPSMNGHRRRVNGHGYASEEPSFDSDESDEDVTTPELFTSAGAQEALHPLRRTADRVTRQIEAFAEKLDRFKQKEYHPDDARSFQAAYQLVQSYQTLAKEAIQDISRQQTLKRARSGWSASRSSSLDPSDTAGDDKTEEEMKRLQLEADTWRLLSNLLSIDNPAARTKSKKAQETCFQTLHRYSSDREIWEQFLDADHYAMECIIAMKWLEQTAQASSQDVDTLIAELETQAERGQGLWAHGWLYTKETIKGQKRLRAWPQPLEPKDPGITLSLLTSEKQEPLITQLDPDAIVRQKLGLQKQDQFHERATWLTCWKMLRHGESWTTIREWAHQRLEHWRAVSLCGSSVDPSSGTGRTPLDDGTTRMMNFQSQDSWRAACSALARDANTEEFERAVYALLCGELEPAYKVCQSWDDYLYVYLNAVVLSRYQGFCKQFQRKLSLSSTSPVVYVPEPAGYADVHKFLQYAKNAERVGVEARNPYRTIQGAILSKSYDTFFHSLAKSVSKANKTGPEPCTYIPDLSLREVDDSMLIAAQDKDALRMATHLYVVASTLGYVRSDSQFVETASVNTIGYIANLEDAGLFDIIPLYASLLPADTATVVLGQILIEIVSPRERKKQVRLIQKQNINIEAVLESQWQWVSANASAIKHSIPAKGYPKVVIRKDGIRELAPIKKDFIGTFVSPEDEQLIRSFEWLRYIDGQWAKICHLGELLYRQFYVAGKLAAARELSRRMRLSEISLEAFGFDVAAFPLAAESVVGAEPSEPDSPRTFRRSQSPSNGIMSHSRQSLMGQQSQTMRDLEQLILGFDGVESFALAWDEYDKNKHRRDSNVVKELKGRLQEAAEELMGHVTTILEEGWLPPSDDGSEEEDLEYIRITYVPELVLDYHNALYYCAHTLSSEYLVECMNLAKQVADNEPLTQIFVSARRMGELVDALALSSKAIVNTKAKHKKRFPNGETLGIWDVKVEGDGEDDDREMLEGMNRRGSNG